MMITQTPQTAPAMLSWDDAVREAHIDRFNGTGISAAAARTIAGAYMSPNTPALVALASGTDVDSDALRVEVQTEFNFAKSHPHTEEDDLIALAGLVEWIDDRANFSE